MSADREGGCACGAVRYRLTSDPLFVHCCHCLNRQRQTGSAFVINLLLEADRVELIAGTPQPTSPTEIAYFRPGTGSWATYPHKGACTTRPTGTGSTSSA